MDATKQSFVVAIDGPAGAGKSTAARMLAARLGYTFLDTGALYRAVAFEAERRRLAWDPSFAPALGQLAGNLDIRLETSGMSSRVFIGAEDVTAAIRQPEISRGASQVSAYPEVRAALLDVQRRLGESSRLVAEGRDVGTVVFPHAPAKFFLTASPAERARRRTLELRARGVAADPAEVEREILQRDERDSTRAIAPLRKAADAIEIDTGQLTPEQVTDLMIATVRARGG